MSNTQRSIIQTIRTRASFRSYRQEGLPKEARQTLGEALDAPPLGPFGGQVKLDLLEAFDARSRGVAKLGTYGMIRGARNYLVGRVARGPHDMEDFGYVFEWLILRATDLGLGTCWLGGTFKRGAFGQAVGASGDEVIPAVSPVGLATTRRGLVDRVVRFAAKSKRRKGSGELFFVGDFQHPLPDGGSDQFAQVLEMVRLGPSASNKQPWRIVVEDDWRVFHLYVLRNAGYQKLTSVDLQRIDMGIAMCHFDLSAKELGLSGSWTEEDPGLAPLSDRCEYIASWRTEG